MIRNYIATYDNGRDYGEFSFSSERRAGSQANKDDARKAMIFKYGKHARNYEIIDICLNK